jgi:RNA polymerase sigma-70 factor (ECF subfamily)
MFRDEERIDRPSSPTTGLLERLARPLAMMNPPFTVSQTPLSSVGSRADGAIGWRPSHISRMAMAELDDTKLAEALIAGEPSAMRVAWERFAPVVRRMVKRKLGTRSDAEDIAQEVFTILFERVATLRDPSALKSFATSIASFRIQTELRRRRRDRALVEHAPVYLDFPRVTYPNAEARQALSRFGGVLQRLKPEERTIFLLRFVKGTSLIDIANASGLSLSTVKRRLGVVWRRVSLWVSRDPILAGYLSDTDLEDLSPEAPPDPPEKDVA